MNRSSQRLCAWSGPAFALLFFVGFGAIARFIPPPSPASSAEAVAAMYRHHANAIRLGMVVSMFGLVLYVPWVAAISVQLKRIEGRHSPLTLAQLGLGATLAVAFFPALYFFEVAAFRPGRAPEIIQTLNDMGWLPFTGMIYAIFVENIIIALVVLSDKRNVPIYPKWFAYVNVGLGLLYCPACLDVFSTHGDFAWNGLWSWWMSLVSFFVWLVVTTTLTLRAITNQKLDTIRAAEPDPLVAAGVFRSDPVSASSLEEWVAAINAVLSAIRHEVSQLSSHSK